MVGSFPPQARPYHAMPFDRRFRDQIVIVDEFWLPANPGYLTGGTADFEQASDVRLSAGGLTKSYISTYATGRPFSSIQRIDLELTGTTWDSASGGTSGYLFVGASNNNTDADNGSDDYVGLRATTNTTDQPIKFATSDGTTEEATDIDTYIGVDAKVAIIQESAGVWVCYVDGTERARHSTNVPTGASGFGALFIADNQNASGPIAAQIDYWRFVANR